MNENFKKILIRRRIREVITVEREQPKIFVCEQCGSRQISKSVDNANNKFLTNGEDNHENSKQTS